MATPFSDVCSVVLNNTYGTSGTRSLTRSNLGVMTPTLLASIYGGTGTWYEMTELLKTQFEMKACGIQRNGLYDWISSSNKPGLSSLLTQKKLQKSASLIQPFIMGRQMSVYNSDYWTVTNGWTHTAYNALGAPGAMTAVSSRVIRVIPTYGAAIDKDWFRSAQRIYILDVSSTGTAQMGQWKVLNSCVVTGQDAVDVNIILEGHNTTNVNQTPTGNAVVLQGINNVNDFETFSALNRATTNPVKHVPFWAQTYRWGRRVDNDYLDLLAKLMEDNKYFAEFVDLPLAEKNRQDEEQRQREFVHSFLFNRPISANQTLASWGSLDDIYAVQSAAIDNPGVTSSTQLMAKRANAIGIYEQMKSCGRVLDLQGQKLNIEEFLGISKELTRARNSQAVDWMGSYDMCRLLQAGLIAYTKTIYGDILRLNIETGTTEFGFDYTRYRLPGWPFELSLISEKTFDDWSGAFSSADDGTGKLTTRSNMLLALDVGSGGTIYPATLASNRVVHKVGDLTALAKVDSTYAYAMATLQGSIQMNSETVTFVNECPKNSFWIEGPNSYSTTNTGKTGSSYYDLV